MNNRQKAIIYLRKARDERQVEHNSSLKTQERRCLDYCKKRNLQVVKTFGEISCAKLSKQTKLLQAIIYCKNNEVYIIVAQNISRFARNSDEYVILQNKLCGEDIELIATKKIDEENEPIQKLGKTLALGFATFDKDMRSIKAKRAWRRKMRKNIV